MEEEIRLHEIERVEKGEEGVRLTLKNGERKFVGGDDGFNLYRKWMEHGGKSE